MKMFAKLFDMPSKLKCFWRVSNLVLVALFWFSVPSISDRSGVYHIISLLIIALFLASSLTYSFLNHDLRVKPAWILMIIFGFVMLLSTLINDPSRLNTTPFSMILLFVAAYFLSLSKDATVKNFCLALFAGGFLFSIYFGVVYWNEIIHLEVDRLGDYFTNVNRVGDSFSLSFSAGLLLLFIEKRPKKWIVILISFGCLVFAFFSFLTGSKAVLLAEVGSLYIALWMIFSAKNRIFLVVLPILLILCVPLLANIPVLKSSLSRFTDMFAFFLGDFSSDPSTSARITMLAEGFYLFGQRPFFGYGVNGFAVLSGFGTYSHNTISELLCNFGFFGFVAYQTPLFLAFLHAKKGRNQHWLFFLIFIIPILLLQLSFPVFINKQYALLFGAVCGFCDHNNEKESAVPNSSRSTLFETIDI